MTTRTSTRSARAGRRRRKPDPVRTWVRRLERTRPGLIDFTLEALREMYGRPAWQRVMDPTSELVLTILSANSADINAEKAFDALCTRWPSRPPTDGDAEALVTRPGWGGVGVHRLGPPDWPAVADAALDELIDVIRPGGLGPTKAPRIQAVLRRIAEERGDYELEFLGDLPPAHALAWLMGIPGIGRKTASVVLLFSFGMPLMPVDRHIERVAKRVGIVPAKANVLVAHDIFDALLTPEQVHEAHVTLITHGRRTCFARNPACGRCAVAPRCRYVHPRAP